MTVNRPKLVINTMATNRENLQIQSNNNSINYRVLNTNRFVVQDQNNKKKQWQHTLRLGTFIE